MYIIGIHSGHNASVALMEDGEITFAIQDERLTREKNKGGFPERALQECLQQNNLSLSDIDRFVHAAKTVGLNHSREKFIKKYRNMLNMDRNFLSNPFTCLKKIIRNLLPDSLRERRKQQKYQRNQSIRTQFLTQKGVDKTKITFVEHHTCHAAGAAYGWGLDEEFLVVTSDAHGDGLSGTVSTFKGELNRQASISVHDSIARIYALTTSYLGFIPMEHEYKLMGLAPYAEDSKFSREIADFLKSLFQISEEELSYRRKPGLESVKEMGPRLREFYKHKRFDHICAGLQLFVEEFVTKWIGQIIERTGINKIALSGGLFMNVKLNQRIMEMKKVNDVFILPSCSDESNVLGALYETWFQETGERPEPLTDLYLGGSFSNQDVVKAYDEFEFQSNEITMEKKEDIEQEVSDLLAQGEAVARFKGRMEFGARALGNRSILARPDDYDVKNEINDMIKDRDFWMPFAPSMINMNDHVQNPKSVKAPYMILAFDSNQEKLPKMKAAVHPYDDTCRPQEVSENRNSDYYELIKSVKDKIGEGIVLNTSFNLHGYPIVYKPKEAFHVLNKSGLKYLAIEDYLVHEK